MTLQHSQISICLALDLGTQTGWAIRYNGQITSGTQSFKPHRFEGGGMRFLRFQRWLNELHQLTGFGEVHFEEVRRPQVPQLIP